jgi:hypothetical protein
MGGEMSEAEMPVDTYPNVEDPEALAAEQATDEETETEYFKSIITDVLVPDEIAYLQKAISSDTMLEDILQKVIVSATEFSGEGSVKGPGDGTSDSIPARLSDGEFVITEKATKELGPENLQALMDTAERKYDGGLVNDKAGKLTSEISKLMIHANKMPT